MLCLKNHQLTCGFVAVKLNTGSDVAENENAGCLASTVPALLFAPPLPNPYGGGGYTIQKVLLSLENVQAEQKLTTELELLTVLKPVANFFDDGSSLFGGGV